jgi:hypothetical protein
MFKSHRQWIFRILAIVVSTVVVGWGLALAPAVPAGAVAKSVAIRAASHRATPQAPSATVPPYATSKGKPTPVRQRTTNHAPVASGSQTVINFADLANGTVVTDQYPSATFSSTSGNVNYVSDQPVYNTPSFICTGPAGGSIDCTADTVVDFTSPVSDLTFDGVGINDTGQVAEVEVFDASGLIATIPIIGDAGGYTAQLVDLSAYNNVTSIDLTDITDSGGIGWTNFSFTQGSSFTVSGSDKSTTGQAGKQATGSLKDAKICKRLAGQFVYNADEAEGALIVGTWQTAGFTTASEFLADFLGGSGDAVSLPDTSQAAAEIKKSSAFISEKNDILTYIGQRLAGGATQIQLPAGPYNVHALAFLEIIREPDLYFALRRTNEIDVSGSGHLVGTNYVGSLTFVISESYGFSKHNGLGGFGRDMRYLQTTCGAPYYLGGAHWFPASVTVTVSFHIPSSDHSR